MPRKPATKVPVPPTLGEDPAERKRVLNILAQRRYRKRKKERLLALESRAKAALPAGDVPIPDQQGSQSSRAPSESENVAYDLPSSVSEQGSSIDSNSVHLMDVTGLGFNCNDAPIHVGFSIEEANAALSSTVWSKPQTLSSLNLSVPGASQPETSLAISSPGMADTLWGQLAACSDWNLETNNFDHIGDSIEGYLPVNIDGTLDLSAELQADDTSFFTFPDDRILEVPSLTLLNAAMAVAQRLKINNLIWDFTAVSPFYNPTSSNNSIASPPSSDISLPSTSATSPASSFDLTELPSHLLPTRTQRLIPHHPVIDLLPWPSTRDKLIQVFHLPISLRPQTAQDPMGLVRLIYDMEDGGGEGVRISGNDPFEPSFWEIGQVVFERWWWAFETSVVERSNRARGIRGERILTLES